MKVSEETKDSVQEIAEQFGKSKKEGKEDFMELYKLFTSKSINIKGESIETVVLKSLKAKYSAGFSQRTTEFEAYLIDIAKPRDIITKEGKEMVVSNAYIIGINHKDPNAKHYFGKVGHFDNISNMVLELEKGSFYKVNLHNKGVKNNLLNVSAVETTSWKKLDKEVEGFDDPSEVVKKVFPKVEIAEGEMKMGDGKIFLVEGRVVSAKLVDKKDGSGRLGIYKVVDDSIDDDPEELETMGGGMTVFADENMMSCGMYSTALFIGRFSVNNDYGGIQMNAELVIPVIHVPFDPSENVSSKQTQLTDENEDDSVLEDEDL